MAQKLPINSSIYSSYRIIQSIFRPIRDLEWFIGFGALLAYIRDNSYFTPDGDIDVGVIGDIPEQSMVKSFEKQGYRVVATASQLKATRNGTGETFIVNGDDPYANACELAQKIGIDLEDGSSPNV